VETVHTVAIEPKLRYDEDHVGVLANHITKAVNMRALQIHDSTIAPQGWPMLALALAPNALTELAITNTPLGTAGAQQMFAVISPLNMRVLDLTNTGLGAEAINSLAQIFGRDQTRQRREPASGVLAPLAGLKQLNLSRNMLGDVGAQAISRLLHALPHLHDLQLAGTRLTALGTRHILRAAPDSLRHLDLADTTICSTDLAKALHSLKSLTQLDITATDVDVTNEELLEAALDARATTTLRVLNVGDCQSAAWIAAARRQARLTISPAEPSNADMEPDPSDPAEHVTAGHSAYATAAGRRVYTHSNPGILTGGILYLVAQREAARTSSDWGAADRLRDTLRAAGVNLSDTDGTWTAADGRGGAFDRDSAAATVTAAHGAAAAAAAATAMSDCGRDRDLTTARRANPGSDMTDSLVNDCSRSRSRSRSNSSDSGKGRRSRRSKRAWRRERVPSVIAATAATATAVEDAEGAPIVTVAGGAEAPTVADVAQVDSEEAARVEGTELKGWYAQILRL
jgi:hypothetical protein